MDKSADIRPRHTSLADFQSGSMAVFVPVLHRGLGVLRLSRLRAQIAAAVFCSHSADRHKQYKRWAVLGALTWRDLPRRLFGALCVGENGVVRSPRRSVLRGLSLRLARRTIGPLLHGTADRVISVVLPHHGDHFDAGLCKLGVRRTSGPAAGGAAVIRRFTSSHAD